MALKLFNHRVNPSFGQHAIGGPTRVASAKAAATSAMGDAFANATASVAKYVSAQNAAEDDLLLQKEISKSKKLLGETEGYFYGLKVYEPGDPNAPAGLDDYVTNWQEESGADPTKPVYIDQIFPGYIESQYDSVMNGSLSRLGKSNQSAYIKSMTPDMVQSANSSNETSVKLQNARIMSEATANIEEAMRLGKTQEALDLIKIYEDKHIFLPHVAEEFRSKATSDDTLGKSQYLSANQVLESDDSAAIDKLADGLWEPDSKSSKMTTEQKIKIQGLIDKREEEITTKAAADAKKWRDDQSANTLINSIVEMQVSGKALSFTDLNERLDGMTNADKKALLRIQEAAMKGKSEKAAKSDPDTLRTLDTGLTDLSIPADDIPMSIRKANYRKQLNEAYDSEQITSSDYIRLWKGINTAETMLYNGRDYKFANNTIFETLIGSSKSAMQFTDKSSERKQNAMDMEKQLNDEIRKNPDLDATQWVYDNLYLYTSKAYELIHQAKLTAAVLKHLVKDDNGDIDLAASKKAQEEWAEKTNMNDADLKKAGEILDDLANMKSHMKKKK